MKNSKKRIISLLLVLALLVSLAACGNKNVAKIHIDGNGLASWNAVKGAVCYEYCIVDAEYSNMGYETTTETQYQLPEGFAIQVRPIFENGKFGTWSTSDYYGEPRLWSDADSAVLDAVMGGEIGSILLDEKGWATWEPVEGAVEYRCGFVDLWHGIDEEVFITQTSIRVPLDHCVEVTPIMADGTPVPSGSSDYHGNAPAYTPEEIWEFYHSEYAVKASSGKTYNLIENIDMSTVQTAEDGIVTFTARGTKGDPMRFCGTGITVEAGAITFEPGSKLYALDAIGRICAYKSIPSDGISEDMAIEFTGGYTFNEETSVESVDKLFKVWPITTSTAAAADEKYAYSSVMEKQPNMIGIGAGNLNTGSFTLSELIVYYDESSFTTDIASLHLDYRFYGTYLEGDFYDPAKESYDSANKDYTFYLMLIPELQDKIYKSMPDFLVDSEPYFAHAVIDIPMDRYEIGELKDPDGNVMNKETAPLTVGCTLEIIIDGVTYDLELPIVERASGVETLHELTPYGNAFSIGNVTPLVVPVQWSDYADPTPEESLDQIRKALGRVVDEDGNVTDYSTDIYSLSAYYESVSRGNYHIESFLTDWVTMPSTFDEAMSIDLGSHSLPDDIFAAVQEMYPNLDWSRFDSNGDGLVDAVIYIATSPESDTYFPASIAGGVQHTRGYDNSLAGTLEDPNIKDFAAVGLQMFALDENVLLHEYAHFFGLIDYYDVSYSGVDAVGSFDMQSGNYGDWNAYSKYSVGWITPEVVTGLASGESVEITIGAQSETGDAIVIPAAGAEFDGPFGEYILVDLFTDTGVNKKDTAESDLFDLADEVGVRIYHVNATMERRVLIDKYGDETVIGTVNVANDYKDSGKYHIELLQRGGNNTYTDRSNLRTQLAPQDFFRAGDTFDAAKYREFLTDGRMDDGSEFGYTIRIVSIEENGADSTAVIRITRN